MNRTLKNFFSIAAILLTTLVAAQSAAEFHVLAEADAEAGNLKRSIKLSNKAVELEPRNADYVYLRAKTNFEIGRFDQAKEDLEETIYLDSTHAGALHYRAKYYFIIEHYRGCVEDNDKALEYTNDKDLIASILLNRGEAKLMLKNAEGAYEDLLEGLAMDTANMHGITVMASTLHELKRHEEALPYLNKLIQNNAKDIGARINKGFELEALGRYKEAIAAYNDAQQIDKNEPLVYSNRARAYYGLKEYEQALKDVNKSLANQPMNGYAYHTRALIRLAQGEKSKACKDLEHSRELMFSKQVNDLFDKNCR